MRSFARLTSWLVPVEWRQTVWDDLSAEARSRRRGVGWLTWQIDSRMIGAAIVAVLLATLAAGLMPAWRATRVSLLQVMQQGSGTPSHRRARSGRAVLAFEAAIGIVLVAGAAVAGRSFLGLVTTDVGYRPEGLHVVRVEPTGDPRGGDDAVELARDRAVLDVLRRQRDVVSAAAVDVMPGSTMAPMTGAVWNGTVRSGIWRTTDGLLPTIGSRLVAGRDIGGDDLDHQRPVAVLSEAAVRQLWPGAAASEVLGRSLAAPEKPALRVVGVAADIRDVPHEAAPPRVFVPVTPTDIWFMEFVVRTLDGLPPNTNALRAELAPLGVTGVTTHPAGSRIDSALQQPRAQTIIFGSFGAIGAHARRHRARGRLAPGPPRRADGSGERVAGGIGECRT